MQLDSAIEKVIAAVPLYGGSETLRLALNFVFRAAVGCAWHRQARKKSTTAPQLSTEFRPPLGAVPPPRHPGPLMGAPTPQNPFCGATDPKTARENQYQIQAKVQVRLLGPTLYIRSQWLRRCERFGLASQAGCPGAGARQHKAGGLGAAAHKGGLSGTTMMRRFGTQSPQAKYT